MRIQSHVQGSHGSERLGRTVAGLRHRAARCSGNTDRDSGGVQGAVPRIHQNWLR